MQATSDVYGAGDIVRFPLPLIEGDTNIGHWQIAHNHGEYLQNNTSHRLCLMHEFAVCRSSGSQEYGRQEGQLL